MKLAHRKARSWRLSKIDREKSRTQHLGIDKMVLNLGCVLREIRIPVGAAFG